MPKPMRVTPELKEQIIAAFMQRVSTMSFLDGKFSFVQDFIFRKDARVKIEFTFKAYMKMMTLVDSFNTEIAWHGLVDRVSENHFLIDDIIVYPQVVSGTTVNTDQEEYDQWLMTIEGDDFNRLKFQGHSHADMPVSPSVTDLQHQGKIVSQLGGEGFYIFMIVNKDRQYTMKVYDAENNTLFENDSVDLIIPEEAQELDKFLTEAEKQVTTYRYTANYSQGAGYAKSRAVQTFHFLHPQIFRLSPECQQQ